MVKNKFKCLPTLWRKMTAGERYIYNEYRSYDKAMIAPDLLLTPDAWETISHNFSYLAATYC